MAVCIAGMHRSGTSLVARVLLECGLYLGPAEELLPAQLDNRDGFWEHAGLTELNDELLARLGGSWDNPPALNDGWERDGNLEPLERRAQALLAPLRQHSSWGWKDPRSSLTLAFWRRVAGEELKVVVGVRHPSEIVGSLVARNGMAPQRAESLTLAYLDALRNDPGNRVVVEYEAILAEPGAELKRLTDALELEPHALQVARALEAVNGSLRHQKRSPEVPPEVMAAYEALRAEAAGPREPAEAPPLQTQLEAARSLLDETRGDVYAAQDEVAGLRERVEGEALRWQRQVEAMEEELERGKEYADGLVEQLHTIESTRFWRLTTSWWRLKARIGGLRRSVG